MAGIDYNVIGAKIKEVLDLDQDVQRIDGVKVSVEDDVQLDAGPWVAIFLTRRRAPVTDQRIAAGRKLVYQVEYRLWCWEYSVETPPEAIRLRNILVSNVEIALLRERQLRGAVEFIELEGGEMATVKNDQGFASGAEVIVLARVTATVDT